MPLSLIKIPQDEIEAYTCITAGNLTGSPVVTGAPFNDAYRCTDWLLMVPSLLIKNLPAMELADGEGVETMGADSSPHTGA